MAAAGAPASQPVLTRAGSIIGTPDYMSPEQALGQPIDARSDLYSAGVILFEMLAGTCPFAGGAATVLRQHVLGETPELPPDVLARVDPRVGPLLRVMLAKTPDNRPTDAAELVAAIRECSRVQPPNPAPPGARSSLDAVGAMTAPVAERGRRRTLIIVAALIAVAIVLGFVARPEARESSSAMPAPSDPPITSTRLAPAPTPSAAPVTVLPPPPAPSSSPQAATGAGPSSSTGSGPAKPASGQGHRTGPGGIYIPPPSQWFR
jgi:serine/threonine-protein kinase